MRKQTSEKERSFDKRAFWALAFHAFHTNYVREIFSDHGSGASCAAGFEGAPMAASAAGGWEGVADCGSGGAAEAAGLASAGGETLRGSIGNKEEFCAAHLAASPFSGLLVLYS